MSRPAQPLLQRLHAQLRLQRRCAGLVVILVLGLIGAPAWSALRNECDLCPRTCPMHRGRDGGSHAQPGHLKCHAAPAGMSLNHHGAAHERGPSVSRASCGNHGVVPATVLPPMLLPAALPQMAVAAVRSDPLVSTARHDRLTDPPDTPPPIRAA